MSMSRHTAFHLLEHPQLGGVLLSYFNVSGDLALRRVSASCNEAVLRRCAEEAAEGLAVVCGTVQLVASEAQREAGLGMTFVTTEKTLLRQLRCLAPLSSLPPTEALDRILGYDGADGPLAKLWPTWEIVSDPNRPIKVGTKDALFVPLKVQRAVYDVIKKAKPTTSTSVRYESHILSKDNVFLKLGRGVWLCLYAETSAGSLLHAYGFSSYDEQIQLPATTRYVAIQAIPNDDDGAIASKLHLPINGPRKHMVTLATLPMAPITSFGNGVLSSLRCISRIDMTAAMAHVTRLGDKFLHESSLVTFDFSHFVSLETIGDYCLSGCDSLESVEGFACLRSLRSIGNQFLFRNAKLKRIAMGSEIQELVPTHNGSHRRSSSGASCETETSSVVIAMGASLGISTFGEDFLGECPQLASMPTLSQLLAADVAVSMDKRIPAGFLANTALQRVDLTPFEGVTAVGKQFLKKGKLSSIDLTPLRHVTAIGDDFLSEQRHLTVVDASALQELSTIADGFCARSAELHTLKVHWPKLLEIGNGFLSACHRIGHPRMPAPPVIKKVEAPVVVARGKNGPRKSAPTVAAPAPTVADIPKPEPIVVPLDFSTLVSLRKLGGMLFLVAGPLPPVLAPANVAALIPAMDLKTIGKVLQVVDPPEGLVAIPPPPPPPKPEERRRKSGGGRGGRGRHGEHQAGEGRGRGGRGRGRGRGNAAELPVV